MKQNKITSRSQVYRAVYYSGFDWKREGDKYILNISETEHIILDHFNRDNVDVISMTSETELNEKIQQRLIRLIKKIQRRTKNLLIEQTLVNLEEKGEAK